MNSGVRPAACAQRRAQSPERSAERSGLPALGAGREREPGAPVPGAQTKAQSLQSGPSLSPQRLGLLSRSVGQGFVSEVPHTALGHAFREEPVGCGQRNNIIYTYTYSRK
jgi:hypothetical protein